MSAPMSIDKLIVDLRAGLEGTETWNPAFAAPSSITIRTIRTLLDALAATLEENQGLRSALDERDVLLESAEKQIVSLYRAAAPGGNYDNELTINGHVSGNNFADSDEVVIAIRGSRRATPDHGAAG